jgi:hypothetical protein
MKTTTRRRRTNSKIKKEYPAKNAFTFAQELAIKYKWPSFIYDGEVFTPFIAPKTA